MERDVVEWGSVREDVEACACVEGSVRKSDDGMGVAAVGYRGWVVYGYLAVQVGEAEHVIVDGGEETDWKQDVVGTQTVPADEARVRLRPCKEQEGVPTLHRVIGSRSLVGAPPEDRLVEGEVEAAALQRSSQEVGERPWHY